MAQDAKKLENDETAMLDSDLDKMLDESENTFRANAKAKAADAQKKLRTIALSYPRSTPDAHIIFGAAGIRYTLGDLRDLFGMPPQ